MGSGMGSSVGLVIRIGTFRQILTPSRESGMSGFFPRSNPEFLERDVFKRYVSASRFRLAYERRRYVAPFGARFSLRRPCVKELQAFSFGVFEVAEFHW